MFKKHSDRELIEGIKKGEDKAINYLYESYFGVVKAHILKNSGNEDDAYDIFQDALMVLYKKTQINHIELSSDLKGYVFGIARNLWNNQLRRMKKLTDLDHDIADDLEIDKMLDTPVEQIVQRSFLKLKPDSQKILTLFLQGYNYKQIAGEMNYKSEAYARRKKYLCKEELIEIIKSDPEYKDYGDLVL
ncbi:MAG TPA: sigma-70 family RNA polymerase sigma factor [Bacteroidales bacterium]|nr:sigma-70 family RNA polymerase sigma factor [Bacteroidales bacterium]